MARRISPQQLKFFKETIQGRRVLDVGNANSQFLAEEFARYAAAWVVVGRAPPPSLSDSLKDRLRVIPEAFGAWTDRPPPSDFDVIVLPSPSPSSTQGLECLQWAGPQNVIVFFGDPKEDDACGSPEFWQYARRLRTQRDERDLWSRMLVLEKPEELSGESTAESAEAGASESHGHFPKKGERYRLAPNARWPGKEPGEHPPVVEITRHWERKSGPAKIVSKGDVIHVRKADLGAKM